MTVIDAPADPLTEWLLHARPVGLVLGPNIIREEELVPPRQGAVETEGARALLAAEAGEDAPALSDPWAFLATVLGWEARYVAGAPGGPALSDDLAVKVPEHDVTLIPDWAVRELGDAGGFQLLVRLQLDATADQRRPGADWEASPQQQFERLLRDSETPIGVLVDGTQLRVVYAPRGETSGWIAFPLRSLGTVAGRAMLGGLKLLLGHARLFTEPEQRRLPKLLARSREAQNQVSTRLAEQVLGALHELLRAFHAADSARIAQLADKRPQHLYEGLLTTLLRLVFLLYAEDRDLIPTVRSGAALEVYEDGYSVRGLYARLAQDRALNPDTMDERVGGWGRLLALFRLVHAGHPSGWITARGGKLFDSQAFPFLEARDPGTSPEAATVLPIRDGALLRILEGLMTIEARTLSGERVRERLSYRALDVEQIGSVYETVMGFRAQVAAGQSIAIRAGKNNRTPVFVDLDALAGLKGKERIKYLKEEADRGQVSAGVGKAVEAAKNAAELAAALDPIVDERASPKKQTIAAGTPILQPTDERRRTGSHYTPRSLTEPIVRHALEPAFERLGEQATPEQILDLKVCDPAMGSGAFLVEACRALATRLVAAWARHPGKRPVIPPDEDEELHARRLVAQRCLYGVDKNPLAVDLAKLSLWLTTLAREHEFTFLDHALKSGDSLVGLTQAQIKAAHWDTAKPGLPLFRQLVEKRVAEATKGRAEIQAAPDDAKRLMLEQKHQFVEERVAFARTVGDAVIAAFFAEDRPRPREKKRAEVESWVAGSTEIAEDKLRAMAATLQHGAHPLKPLHWEIEFPEVFSRDNSGFDVFVGNPPFLGGTRIATELSKQYVELIKFLTGDIGDRADLVAYFFRKAFLLLRPSGSFGLIGSNTIAQGDTRNSGLRFLLESGGMIYRAIRRLKWPGEAAVMVSIIHVARTKAQRQAVLNGNEVERITPFLFAEGPESDPKRLSLNKGRAAEGMGPYGEGFRVAAAELVAKKINSNAIVPYARGKVIFDAPQSKIEEAIIFFRDWSLDRCRREFPDELRLVERYVQPDRAQRSPEVARAPWWLFWRPRMRLWVALEQSSVAFVKVRVSPHHALLRLSTPFVPDTSLVAFINGSFPNFSILQSGSHEMWARFFSSSMKDDLRYTPSDCFETFPFPSEWEASAKLESSGEAYYGYRAALMIKRNEGMTKTYNRFHDPNETANDIERLRELHAAMDRAVLEAYGWHDLAARAKPVFLDETNEDDHTYQGRLFWPSAFRDEVLARLLALNAERHAEEVRLGIAPGMKGKTRDDESEDDELEDRAR